jgi:hypothetical protein
MQMVRNSKQRRHKQGLVPDIAAENSGIAGAIDAVDKPTLFELKQVNLVIAYFAAGLSQRVAHAVGRTECHNSTLFPRAGVLPFFLISSPLKSRL